MEVYIFLLTSPHDAFRNRIPKEVFPPEGLREIILSSMQAFVHICVDKHDNDDDGGRPKARVIIRMEGCLRRQRPPAAPAAAKAAPPVLPPGPIRAAVLQRLQQELPQPDFILDLGGQVFEPRSYYSPQEPKAPPPLAVIPKGPPAAIGNPQSA